MKKVFLTAALAAGLLIQASAQETTPDPSTTTTSDSTAQTRKFRVSIGFDAGLPVGDQGAKDSFKMSLGGSIKGEYKVATNLNILLTAGFTSLQTKQAQRDMLPGLKKGFGFVPVKAGAQYFFTRTFYAEAQLGAVFATDKNPAGKTETGFAYAPGVGLSVPIGDKLDADLGVRWEGWVFNAPSRQLNQVAIRLAIKY